MWVIFPTSFGLAILPSVAVSGLLGILNRGQSLGTNRNQGNWHIGVIKLNAQMTY
jgi:hypothetical protein